jgi:CrcB protein
MEIALATDAVPAPFRLALTTGLLGGFTTYSTFNYETMALLQQGSLRLAALNVALTVGGCLAAGLSGLVLARWIVGS